MSHPLSMVLAYFVVGTLYLFLIALTGRSRLSFWMLCAILLPLGAISGSKLKAIGAPYYPWDLVFNNQIVEYKAFLQGYLNFRIMGTVAIFLAIIALLFHLVLLHQRIRFTWIERSIYAVIAIIMATSLYIGQAYSFHEFIWHLHGALGSNDHLRREWILVFLCTNARFSEGRKT